MKHTEKHEPEENNKDTPHSGKSIAIRAEQPAEASREDAERHKNNCEPEDKKERVAYNFSLYFAGVRKRRAGDSAYESEVARNNGKGARRQKHEDTRDKSRNDKG